MFVLVTVPIISNKFLKVYRLTQEKSTNVRFLFVLFSITTILFFIMLRRNIPPGLSLFQPFLNNRNTDFSISILLATL